MTDDEFFHFCQDNKDFRPWDPFDKISIGENIEGRRTIRDREEQPGTERHHVAEPAESPEADT